MMPWAYRETGTSAEDWGSAEAAKLAAGLTPLANAAAPALLESPAVQRAVGSLLRSALADPATQASLRRMFAEGALWLGGGIALGLLVYNRFRR
jgi:hypothetical protein